MSSQPDNYRVVSRFEGAFLSLEVSERVDNSNNNSDQFRVWIGTGSGQPIRLNPEDDSAPDEHVFYVTGTQEMTDLTDGITQYQSVRGRK